MDSIGNVLVTLFSVLGGLSAVIFTVLGILRPVANVLSVISYKRRKKSTAESEQKKYSVLICARNESHTIGRLIRSVLEQDYPSDHIKVFVLADNCTDDTADEARRAGATVFERFNKELIGKAYALDELLGKIKDDPFVRSSSGYIMFDADNIVSPQFVSEINRAVCSGAHLAKGFRNTSNFGENLLSDCHGLYFLSENLSLDLGRTEMGVTPILTGTGYYIDRNMVEEAGGWSWFLLTEDIELTAYSLLKKGYKVAYCHDAVFYDEQPTSWKISIRQRIRWMYGHRQVFDRYGKDLFVGFFKNHSPSFFDLFYQTFTSGYFIGISFAINILSAIVTGIFRGFAAGLLSAVSYVVSLYWFFIFMSAITVLLGRNRILLSKKRKVLLFILFPLFMETFFPIALISLFYKKVEWKPIPHTSTHIHTDNR